MVEQGSWLGPSLSRCSAADDRGQAAVDLPRAGGQELVLGRRGPRASAAAPLAKGSHFVHALLLCGRKSSGKYIPPAPTFRRSADRRKEERRDAQVKVARARFRLPSVWGRPR